MSVVGEEHVEALLGIYALNRVSAAERIEVETHLAVCAECRESYDYVAGAVRYLSLLEERD